MKEKKNNAFSIRVKALNSGAVQKVRLQELSRIAEAFSIIDIYAFGSQAKKALSYVQGKTEKIELPTGSDIDIGVRPCKYLNAKERVELMVALEDFFDVSKVDLVIISEVDLYIALDIIRGELLYTKDPNDQARYELLVLRMAADLAPYKKERIHMILEEGAQ